MNEVLPILIHDGGVYIKKVNIVGNVTYANELYYKKFGYKKEDIINEPFIKFINEECKNIAWESAELVVTQIGKPVILQYLLYNTITCQNEETEWHYLGVKNLSGKITEVNCFGISIKEKISINEVMKARANVDYFFNTSPKPMMVLNSSNEIVKLNDAFANFSKQYPCFLIGKPIKTMLHLSKNNLIEALENTGLKNKKNSSGSYYDEGIGGNINFAIVKNGTYSFLTFSDTKSAIEQTLLVNKYEKILRGVEYNAMIGWWEFSLKEKTWNTSKNAHQIFEFSSLEQDNFKSFLMLLNYSQKRVFMAGVKENLNGRPTKGNFVINTVNGNQKTIKINGGAEYENGEVVRIIGTVQDVTDAKYKERLLRNVMNKTFHDTIVVNKDFKIILFNEKATQGVLKKFNSNEILNQDFFSIFDKHSIKKLKGFFKEVEKESSISVEVFLSLYGETLLFELGISGFKDVSNTLSAFVIKMRNIEEKREVAEKLKDSSFNFSKAQKIAQISTFEYSYEKDEFKFEDDLLKIFPYFKTNILKYADIKKYMSELDLSKLKEVIFEIKSLNETRGLELFIDADPIKMHLLGKAFPVVNDDGVVYKAKGILQNVTERRKNEALLEAVIGSSTFDIVVLDKDFKMVKFNTGYKDSLAFKLDSSVSIGDCILDYMDKDQIEFFKKPFNAAFIGQSNEFEVNIKLCNGASRYSRVYSFPIIEKNGAIEKIVINIFDFEEQKKLQDRIIAIELNKERSVSKVVVDALENERITLGSELHDNVNQILGMSKLTLEYFISSLKTDASVLETTKGYIMKAIDEIRRISYNLSPPNLEDIGLKESLMLLINKLNIANKFKLKFYFTLTDNLLSQEIELAIYRVIQEGVNNIIKHALAKEVNIEITQVKHSVIVLINDNGTGFKTTINKEGVGLKNMRYRTEAVNGSFFIESKLNIGTKVIVKIPI